jgi:hypothetical protein
MLTLISEVRAFLLAGPGIVTVLEHKGFAIPWLTFC